MCLGEKLTLTDKQRVERTLSASVVPGDLFTAETLSQQQLNKRVVNWSMSS